MLRLIIVVWCYSLVALAGRRYRQYIVDNSWTYDNSQNTQKKEAPQQKCTKDRPCYDVTINFVMDGICPFEPGPRPEVFIKHYRRAGKGIKDIIADGREAAQILKEKTGFDFTSLPDMAYLNKQATTMNGSIIFSPNAYSEACNYRVTTVQKGEEVQLINKPIADISWVITFPKDARVYGSINRILPAGSVISVGSYGFAPCEDDEKECRSILSPDDPYKYIYIKSFTRDWLSPRNPGKFIELNYDVEHPVWQNGIARGIHYLPTPERPRADLVTVIRFQWPLEH